MNGQAFQGCGQRTFRQALISMLEKDYRLLGSRRVLALLAEDIESMVNEFYPQPKHLSVTVQELGKERRIDALRPLSGPGPRGSRIQLGHIVATRTYAHTRGQGRDIADGFCPLVSAHGAIAFLDPPANQSLGAVVGPI